MGAEDLQRMKNEELIVFSKMSVVAVDVVLGIQCRRRVMDIG